MGMCVFMYVYGCARGWQCEGSKTGARRTIWRGSWEAKACSEDGAGTQARDAGHQNRPGWAKGWRKEQEMKVWPRPGQ